MNNSDLSERMAADHNLNRADARKIVDALFAAIGDSAAKGEEISLSGFGKFKVKATAAREGRNPATGEPMKIRASRKMTFTAAKALKDKISNRK